VSGDAERFALPPRLMHDLRTPLNHIIGYSELMMEEAHEAGHTGLLPQLQKVGAAGHHLLALINEHFHSSRSTDAAPLPEAVPEPLPAPVEVTAESARASAAARGSLLVVDDVAANRDVLSRRLKRQGYWVAEAETGRQALDMLRAYTFDLVLLDIMMPGMDGFEVLRRLGADDRLRHVAVIVVSALSDPESVARCIELGADDYLSKPFDSILLRARVSASLERKRARDREAYLLEQLRENRRRLRELEDGAADVG
jgi:PleD family two-component response regulator